MTPRENEQASRSFEILKKHRVFAGVLMVSIALCLLAPLWKDERFPHTGTWVFQKNGTKGIESSITFDKLGACSIDYTGASRKYHQKDVPCPYKMAGDNALATYQFKSTRPADPWLYSVYKAKLTPLDGGLTLELELLGAQHHFTGTGRTWQTDTTFTVPYKTLFRKQ
jgi:hypothetical protein